LQLDALDAGPRRFLGFLFLNVLSWQCLIGPVMVLHARALGIESGAVGVLYSLLFFAGVLGVLTKALAERYGSKRVLMAGWTVRNLLVLPVVLTPWVLTQWGAGAAAALLFVTAGLFSMTRALAGIAWSSWLHEIVPPAQLGRFFAAETVMTRLLAVTFGIFAFFVLGQRPPIWRFAAVAALGVGFGLLSIRVLRHVPGGGPSVRSGEPAWSGFGTVLRDRTFMEFLRCVAWFSFVYVGMGLLVLLLLRDQLLLGPGLILLLTTCGNLLAVTTSTRWRRIADHHGSVVVMAAAGLLVVLCLIVMACLRPGRAPLLLVAAVCAMLPVAESGHYVATNRGYMLRMRPELRHATNAVWGACIAVPSGVSAVLMGVWLRGGTTGHYVLATWGYAALMLAGVYVCLRFPMAGSDQGGRTSTVHDPRRPIMSLVRMLMYVLRPGPSVVTITSQEVRAPAGEGPS
jgi:hypothetical protein